ncbi:hypothetical membrane protein, conserved [Thermococcus onnurineus NA1]|uniref:Hypothetical membrane protein, conserved n=1 Tax=Thermococcus onnurineus (strain NA1) TaxID=523850 RepID=B6YW54_THEON|nr:hypothetical protein [Thermococcus onnurineus]ACJ17420.1 hypothetical membrane protein, conserved [Thermococcus onnurineus NA1]
MEPYLLLRILYALFMGAFLIAMGMLTFTARDEPGIGFRIGYTYLSKQAREKLIASQESEPLQREFS